MNKFLYKIPIREFIIPIKGMKPNILRKEPFEFSVPYLDIHTLEGGDIAQYAHRDYVDISSPDDLLVVWDGSRSGLVFKGQKGAIGSTLMCLKVVDLDPDYLFYFLKHKFSFINNNTSGSGIPHVDSEVFFDLDIPYTEKINQKLIVKDIANKLEKNLSLLAYQKELTRQALHATQVTFDYDFTNISKSFNAFKSSIINSAVSGVLSRDWREKQNISNKTINNQKADSLNKYELNEQHRGWVIPDTWKFTEARNLIKRFQYGTSSKSFKEGNTPVLAMSNIKDGKVNFDKLKFTSDINEINKYKLNQGDVLFNRTNSPELVGKTAVFESDINAIFAGYIIKIETTSLINPKFLSYCLNSQFAKDYYKTVMVGSASQANINAEKLGDFLIPLIPISEQNEIIKRAEKLLHIANNIENEYHTAIKHLEDLEKSILQHSFNGYIEEDTFENESLNNLLERLSLERDKVDRSIKVSRKKIRENKKALNTMMQSRRTIVEILEDSPNRSLEVEEVWRNSIHYERWEEDGYEKFFKEIEENKSNVFETRSEDGLTIRLNLKRHENQ